MAPERICLHPDSRTRDYAFMYKRPLRTLRSLSAGLARIPRLSSLQRGCPGVPRWVSREEDEEHWAKVQPAEARRALPEPSCASSDSWRTDFISGMLSLKQPQVPYPRHHGWGWFPCRVGGPGEPTSSPEMPTVYLCWGQFIP